MVWVWVVGFLRFAGPLPSRFPPSLRSCPFLGLGTPFCSIVDPRVFLLAVCEYPRCRSFRVLGLGWLWFGVVGGWVVGFGFWLVAGGYHGYSESLFAAVNRGLPRTICASPLPCEGPLCFFARGPGLGALPTDLVVLPGFFDSLGQLHLPTSHSLGEAQVMPSGATCAPFAQRELQAL